MYYLGWSRDASAPTGQFLKVTDNVDCLGPDVYKLESRERLGGRHDSHLAALEALAASCERVGIHYCLDLSPDYYREWPTA